MESRSIVPDGEVVLIPLEADLRVMVLSDKIEEVGEEDVALVLGDAVDALGEAAVDKDGFPSRHWVGPDCFDVSADAEIQSVRKTWYNLLIGCTASNASPEFNGLPLIPLRIGFPNRLASS